jgi:hypothetical protein
MNITEALIYLKRRLGEARVSGHLITDDTGRANGCTFKVGRSKLVIGRDVEEFRLALFADGIDYSEKKSAAKRAAK